MSSLVLDREQTVQLIQAYGARRLLWDAGDPRYFNRKLRERAWRKIAASLSLSVPVSDLKKKIVSLLGSYRREKSRERQSIMSGLGPDEAYKSKWYGYEHFHFMSEKTYPGAPHVHPHHSVHVLQDSHDIAMLDGIKVEYGVLDGEDNVENDLDNECDEDKHLIELASPRTPASSPPPAAPPHPRAKRRRRRADTSASDDDILTQPTAPQETARPHNDSYVAYGLYIASELRKYDSVTLAHVKHAINNIIFEADLGKYKREPAAEEPSLSLSVNEPSTSSQLIEDA